MADVHQKLVNVVVKVVGDADKAVRKVTSELKKFDSRIKGSSGGATKFSTATKQMEKQLEKFQRQTKQTTQQARSLDATLGQITGSIARTAAVIGSIAFPVVKAAQFQRAMSEVQALFGATGRDLELLTAKAREMGATTEYSALEAASGMKYLAMAGLSAEQSMTALPNVLNLAQAGALDLGRAADISTNIMTGFGFAVEDLARVNDVLVQTFTNTNSTLEELGEAMSYVGPVAAGLGADFEDVTAALGLLHSAGIKGSMAGTSLRGTMVRLVSPTKEASKGIEAISERLGGAGLVLRDQEGNWVGFTSLVKQLEEAGATTTEVIDILGQRAGPGLAALLSQGSRALERMTQLNKQAAGRASEIAKVMHENVVGSLKAFQSAAIETAIEIGSKLLPAIDKFLKFAADLFIDLGNLAKMFPKVTAVTTAFTAAVVGLFGVMLTASTISLILTGRTVAWGAALGAVKTQLLAVRMSMVLLTSTLVALAALLVGVTFSKTVRDWVSDFEFFGVQVKEIVVTAVASVLKLIEDMIKGVHGLWMDLNAMPAKVLGKILEVVGQWGAKLVDTIGQIPGLGKMLGWDDEGNKVRKVFDDLSKAGQQLVANANAEAAASKQWFGEKLSTGEQVLDQVFKEMDARQKIRRIEENYQAVRAKEVELEQEMAQAAQQVIESRKKGLVELEKASKNAEKRWSAQNEALTNFIAAGDTALSDLATSIQKNITSIWEEVTGDAAVEGYRQSLAALEAETETFGTNNAQVMAEASSKLADAQIEAVTAGLTRIEGMYDAQVQAYRTFQEMQTNTAGESAERRAQIERDNAKKIEKYSLGVLEKKKIFYEKATTALKAELERSREAEAETAKKIIDIQESIRLAKMSAEDKIRELRRKTMSEEEVYNDKLKQYNEYMVKAQENVGTNYKAAIEYANKAREAAGDLTKETKDGKVSVDAAIEGIQKALEVQKQAAAAEKKTLEESMQAHQDNTAGLEEAFNTITKKLSETRAALGEGLKATMELDTTDFYKQMDMIRQQKALVVKVRADLDEVNRQLGEWQLRTAEMGEEAVLKIQTQGEAELKTMLDTLSGVQEKLKEDVILRVSKGEELDETTETLARLAGIKVSLNEETAQVTVTVGDETVYTGKKLAELEEKKAQVTAPATLVIKDQVEVKDTDDLVEKIRELPTVEAPHILDVQAGESVKQVKTEVEDLGVTFDNLPKDTTVSVSSTTLEPVAKQAGSLKETLEKVKENVVVTATVKGVEAAVSALRSLADAISKLPSFTEITVVKKVITKYSTEGTPPAGEVGAQTGMRISGYGGGDRVPALLEPGEWVIRKEAVRKYGDAFLARLNAGLLPRFASGGKVFGDAVAGMVQRFGTGGRVKKYEDFSLLVEALNKLGDELEYAFHQGKDPRALQQKYIPMGRAVPDVGKLHQLLDYLDRTPLAGYSNQWKQAFRQRVEQQVGLYEEAGGRDAYVRSRQDYYSRVRKSSPRGAMMTDAEIEYGFTLGQTFGGVETLAETFAKMRESYQAFRISGGIEHLKKMGEIFAHTPGDLPDQPSKKKIEIEEARMLGQVGVEKFAVGGPVRALSRMPRMMTGQIAELAPLFKKFQTGGEVSSAATIRHQVDFTLGNRTFGPFEGSGVTINDFIAELKLAKGRA